MKYTEKLMWILDKCEGRCNSEEEYKQNIAFVHSLGLKCDIVGWSKLDLSDPRTEEVLQAVEGFCRENGWRARGIYTREYPAAESSWYEIRPEFFADSTIGDYEPTTGLKIAEIRAFYELRHGPKTTWQNFYFPDRLRKACLFHGIGGVDFCWARDTGKYAAEQYFFTWGTQSLPRVAVKDKGNFRDAGGWLPRLTEVFYDLSVDLQECYLAEDMPKGGFAGACLQHTLEYMGVRQSEETGEWEYFPQKRTEIDFSSLLIHRDAAELLLREKALPASALRPAPVADVLPAGYMLQETVPALHPDREYIETMQREYEALLAKDRPVREISDKIALKLLRAAKKERKNDFCKAVSKNVDLAEISALEAYYRVTDGGWLSDEYRLLPHGEIAAATEEFRTEMAKEELADVPQGTVVALCPDGDRVLLYGDGRVVRMSHEMPEAIGEWTNAAQFFVEALSES